MATSGNIDFSMTRTDFLEWSLRTAQLVGIEQPIPANLVSHASLSLNMLLATWEKRSRHIFTEQSATVFFAADQSVYSLGTTGDHAADDVVETTLGAAEASGQTVLTLTSTTGMTAADYIGVLLDDNSLHWTTIVSVDSATQVTITLALTDDAASGNKVYTYTTRLAKPLRLSTVQYRDSSDTDVMVSIIDRVDYVNTSDKTSTSTSVSNVYYDPKISGLGKLYVYPTPEDSTTVLKISYQRSLQAFDAAGNTADLPKNWYLALAYGLAALVCPAVGKDKKAALLAAESERYYRLASFGDHDEGSVFFLPADGY